MAATRLIAMHQNKGRTVAQCLKDRTDYAKNGEKTEDEKYVSSYACNAEIADKEFAESKREYLRLTGRKPKGDIIAYQIRQSFKPGEITPEEANEIGYETAMRFTKGNHAFVVATHTDRAHIHNHIIFNSTNLDCDRKFRDSWYIAIALERVSNLVCLEHGMSVIGPRQDGQVVKRSDYPEQKTIRDKIREAIDQALLQKPDDFQKLLQLLAQEDYEIKRGKNTAIRGKEQKRFVRFKSLGDGYSEEDLIKIISGDMEHAAFIKKETKDKSFILGKKKNFDMLIDIQEKLKQGKNGGYTRWAKNFNLKEISKTLMYLDSCGVRDYDELAAKASVASEKFTDLTKIVKDAEKRLAEIAVLKTHIINYSKTRDVYVAYRKSGYNKKFFEEHREEISLHKAAKEAFGKQEGKIPKMKDLNVEYTAVLAKKKEAYSEYRRAKSEMQEFVKAKHNIDLFMGEEQLQEQDHKKNKDKETQR